MERFNHLISQLGQVDAFHLVGFLWSGHSFRENQQNLKIMECFPCSLRDQVEVELAKNATITSATTHPMIQPLESRNFLLNSVETTKFGLKPQRGAWKCSFEFIPSYSGEG